MADVFISHSSIDKEIADKVCAALEAKGLTCWIAPRDIVPGSEWAVAISNAVAEIKAMVVIYSANSQQSTQVPKEIALAEKRGKNILPYKIDDTELTGAFEYYLSGSHWIVADPKKDDYKLDEMYGVIVGMMQQPTQKNTYIDNLIIQNPEQVTVQVQDAVAGVKPDKKKVFLGIGMVTAVVVLLVGILLLVKLWQKEENQREKEKETVSVEQSGEQESEEFAEDTKESQQDTEQIDFEYRVKNGVASVTGYLGNDTHLVIPEYIYGIQITSIADNAFQDCKNLQTIELPEGLQSIGAWAFAESSLTKIKIPESVLEIGENAFINCISLEKVYLPSGLSEIKSYTFFGCCKLANVDIPRGIIRIGDWAFAYTPFSSIDIGKTAVTEIGVGAFASCENLVSVVLPSNVKIVKAGAFQFCEKLASMVIPDEVEAVAYSAFYGVYDVIIEYQGNSYTYDEARYLPIMAWEE